MRYAAPSLFLSLALTGCAIAPTASPVPQQGLALQGEVHGGQQAIQYAHLYLFAANTTGYGGPGIAPSTLNASVPLLNPADPGVYTDSVGPYVLTTNKGNFTISGSYACTANTQVYIYVLGGNPGSGTNAASGLLAALGNCPSALNFNATSYISINEISTVAAAYAMAGFASDATHVSSSGSALAQNGIANAFANASNLANIGTGAALATTPTVNGGNGTVPHDEIITLANILASCINTTGAITGPTNPSTCYTLFTNTLAYGTGTQPTDTATAAINIAHNPAANVTNIFSLAAAKTPYTTTAAYGQPNDWTLAITYTGGGLTYPQFIAIDGYGNAWASNNPYYGKNTLTKLSPTGAILSGANGFAASPVSSDYLVGLAIDRSNNVWVPNYFNSCNQFGYCTVINDYVVELNSSGSVVRSTYFNVNAEPLSPAIDGLGNTWFMDSSSLLKFTPSGGQTSLSACLCYHVAIDGAGNDWVASASYANGPALIEFNSSGNLVSPANVGYTGGGLSNVVAMAVDSGGNVWMVENLSGTSDLSKFSNNGTALSPSAGYTGGGIANSLNIAIDGAGNVWISNFVDGTGTKGSVSEFTNAGVAISPSTGYGPSTFIWPDGIAVDGSGDVWAVNQNASTVTELIGAATPVITPISAGLPISYTTDGTSKLGTRP